MFQKRMKKGIFIQANKKQLFGAKLAQYALETTGGACEAGIPVTIMQVEKFPEYMKHVGMTYKRGGEVRTHDPSDLQFFTLSRFMPPQLMGYEGRALVIDPDIFALQNIIPLFETNLLGNSIASCTKYGVEGAWDSSVMLLETEKLSHWNVEAFLEQLKQGSLDYTSLMQLKNEKVLTIPRTWNSLDTVSQETYLLHLTNRLTQPWKTGLPVDFTPGTVPKMFGVIPRFWVPHPSHYQPHPDKKIEKMFFELAQRALKNGIITAEMIADEITQKNIRSDFLSVITSA